MIDIPEPGPQWPEDVLARRADLALKPDLGEVCTERLVIRRYRSADADELQTLSNGEPVTRMGRSIEAYDADRLIWRFMAWGPFASAADLRAGHDTLDALPDVCTYVVVDHATGELVGSVSLLANVPADLRVEIGAVWYTPAVQGLGVNREVTFGLAEVLFGLGYQRYEWKCNARNLRSRHAADAMGFAYEGTFQAHMVVKGQRRDTAWFALVPADTR